MLVVSLLELKPFKIFERNLSDFKPSCSWFTWTTNRTDCVWESLDGMLCNEKWLLTFPYSQVQALVVLASDHAPILIFTTRNTHLGFQFQAFWTTYADCKEVVQKDWNETVARSLAYRVFIIIKVRAKMKA